MMDPKCPACQSQPLQFMHNIITLETNAVVSIIWCGECGHTLNIAFIGQREPQIAKPQLQIVRQ